MRPESQHSSGIGFEIILKVVVSLLWFQKHGGP